ncbi:MAG: MFS transporter [Anaerolineaceae bacterium]|nr:MFS transporter [Anaerolineaceae bacterium]
MTLKKPEGMKAFTLIWIGQLVSLVGSSMTNFAVGIWAWEKTGQATPLALVGFFAFTPLILFTPIAGVLVDRWNRKLVMALSDLAAGFTTVIMIVLLFANSLEIWHLYVIVAISGIFGAFQWPAYSASISLMIPKEQYTRASGMISLAETGSQIFAPILAAILIAKIGITGIFIIDLVTLVIALIMLLIVNVPNPVKKGTSEESKGSFFAELAYGFNYLFSRASLLGLQLVFFFGNFFAAIAYSLIAPMVLARSAGDATILGTVQSAGAIGGLLGSIALTAWGGPKKKILGVLIGWILTGILGISLFGATGLLPVWIVANFLGMLVNPVLNGSNQAIWQSKVAPDVQGRVFSVRRLIAQVTTPLSMLIAGPLADKVMEPAMKDPESTLGKLLGPIMGIGDGVGMGVIIVVCGLLMALVGAVSFSYSKVRHVETILPDHDALETQS